MAKKKRKTKREKADLTRKRKQQKKQTKEEILIPKKTLNQEANSNQVFQKADYSGLFNQTKLIQKDLLKSIALSFFILASEFVLYWKLK